MVQSGTELLPGTRPRMAYGYDGLARLSQIKYTKAQGTASEQLIE